MKIDDLNVFLDYFDKIHKRTMRVVRCIPPDKVDWSFREGKFTLGDLARHIAGANLDEGSPVRIQPHFSNCDTTQS